MTLDEVYHEIHSHKSHFHPLPAFLAGCPRDGKEWATFRTHFAPLVRSYPHTLTLLCNRLSGEERETLREVQEDALSPESPRSKILTALGIDLTTPLIDDTPIEHLHDLRLLLYWLQVSATLKPRAEALGVVGVAYPVLEHRFFLRLLETSDDYLAQRTEHEAAWEDVLTLYTQRIDLIRGGALQAMEKWGEWQQSLFDLVVRGA